MADPTDSGPRYAGRCTGTGVSSHIYDIYRPGYALFGGVDRAVVTVHLGETGTRYIKLSVIQLITGISVGLTRLRLDRDRVVAVIAILPLGFVVSRGQHSVVYYNTV